MREGVTPDGVMRDRDIRNGGVRDRDMRASVQAAGTGREAD
jgi:hypothetical protein